MASIDLSGLNIDQLTDLVGQAQSEMASREKQRRKDLRSELERRVAADGYKLARHLPGTRERRRGRDGSAERCRRNSGTRRTPRRPGPGSRTVAEVGAGDPRRAGDRHGGVQGDSDVPDPRVAVPSLLS